MTDTKKMINTIKNKNLESLIEKYQEEIKILKQKEEKIKVNANEMSNKELYEHLITIVNQNGGILWEYKDDYVLEKTVEYKLINTLKDLIEVQSGVSEKYLDFEKMTIKQSEDYWFASSPLHPFTLDGRFFVAFYISGQGETFLEIKEVEKENAKYILKYADLNFIKN